MARRNENSTRMRAHVSAARTTTNLCDVAVLDSNRDTCSLCCRSLSRDELMLMPIVDLVDHITVLQSARPSLPPGQKEKDIVLVGIPFLHTSFLLSAWPGELSCATHSLIGCRCIWAVEKCDAGKSCGRTSRCRRTTFKPWRTRAERSRRHRANRTVQCMPDLQSQHRIVAPAMS
jgi:hypothetical protein